MYPETAYAIARIAEIRHEISQPMSHRYEARRVLRDAKRARWNTVVRAFKGHSFGRRHRVTGVAAVAEA